MKPLADLQIPLIPDTTVLPQALEFFPRFRYMGSKFRLLPWIHDTLQEFDFETATDAFSGSGVVSYLLKAMGKQVRANDSLAFPSVLTAATV
jgi:adenine-specific DNA-methyltransferase